MNKKNSPDGNHIKFYKKKKFLVLITILIIFLIASTYFYFFRYRADYVDLIYIEVDISANCTYEEYRDWFQDVRWGENENSIRLSHCSYIGFDGDVITVYGDYDRSTDLIVIIKYLGWGSFSGGGDDVYRKFLHKDESAPIIAAHNISDKLYEIQPNKNDKISLLNSENKTDQIIMTSYNITKLNQDYSSSFPQNRSFQIYEEHNVEIHKNIPVRISLPYPCE
ncbi:MAG: hypothetical protein U9R75_00575 [Candidatus Thermoplasmatota archaeon]|nr:hypothetical protein [Candidatus Thermoplasmatota archaeon]